MMNPNLPTTVDRFAATHCYPQTADRPRRSSRPSIWLVLACALAPTLTGCALGPYNPDPSAESASRSASAAQQKLVAKLQKEIDQAQRTLDELRKLRDAQVQRNADLERSYPQVAKKMQKVLDQFNELQRPVQTKASESDASRGGDSAGTSTP